MCGLCALSINGGKQRTQHSLEEVKRSKKKKIFKDTIFWKKKETTLFLEERKSTNNKKSTIKPIQGIGVKRQETRKTRWITKKTNNNRNNTNLAF